MVVQNTFLIVLFSVLLSHSILAQTSNDPTDWTTDETTSELIITSDTQTNETTSLTTSTTTITTTTTPSTSYCEDPDDFPLFSRDTCVSRTTYTAIFLTSIILAGLSFLMLTALLLCYCCRRCRNSDWNEDDDELSKSNISSRGSVSGARSVDGMGGQNTVVLQNLSGTNPLEDRSEERYNHAPYTRSNHRQPESHEMAERPMNNRLANNKPRTQPTSSPSGPTARPNGITSKPPRLNNIPSVQSTTETSYF